MSYVGNPLATAFAPRVKQDLTGQSGTSFTLSHAVSSANDLSVYINHVRQEPTTAYTVDYTTLTTTGSVASTDDFYIIFDELALQSIAHDEFTAMKATSGTFTGAITTTQLASSGPVSGTTGTFSSDVSLSDNAKLKIGTGDDLVMYHNGNHSFIRDEGTGIFFIDTNGPSINMRNGSSESLAKFITNGAVELYHDNSKKVETTSTGILLESTDTGTAAEPIIELYRHSASPASNDNLGAIEFHGEDDNDDKLQYARVYSTIFEPTHTNERGYLHLAAMQNGTMQDFIKMGSNTVNLYKNTNVTGTLTATTLAGTLSTAAQTNVTSIGTLTSLGVTGSGGDYIATFQNSTSGTPYGVSIKEPSSAGAGYPLLNIANHDGSATRFRVDSSTGHVGIGAPPVAGDTLHIKDTAPSIMLEETSSGGSKRIAMYVSSSGTPIISAAQSGGLVDFYCTGVHTARVHSQGVIGQSYSSSAQFPLQSKCFGTSNSASHSLYLMQQTNHYDTTSKFIQASFYGSGTNYNRFIVYSNGASYNSSNTWGNISDERLKSDITDAKSQWDDIKNIKVRNFKKYDNGNAVQLGVVSQELEKVSPNLVEEVDPSEADIKHNSTFGTLYKDGDDIPEGKEVGNVKEVKEKVKGVKYSILYMKAVKALQEAMERIETLESKVKVLESK